ncbi:hypothetical protein ACFV9C_13760 [Kribbella sp. NPDC059898]
MAVDAWSFDDDRQQHVTAPTRPTRILPWNPEPTLTCEAATAFVNQLAGN